MTLNREDIIALFNAMAPAIAAEVVRQMRIAEDRTLDAEYLASLPVGERKKLQQAKARAALDGLKAAQRR